MSEIGKKASEAGLLRCDLSGGEPLLRTDIVQIIEALLPFVGVMLTTSAVGVPRVRLAAVADLLPVVQVSLDGHTDAMNAARGHSVRRIQEVIDSLVAAGKNVRVLTVAHRYNLGTLPEFADTLRRWGVWEWKVLRVLPVGQGAGWSGRLTDEEAANVRSALASPPLRTQLVGFAVDRPRTCVVLEDDLHLHIDRSGREEDLGPVDVKEPFAALMRLEADAEQHLRYYLTDHSTGGVLERRTGG
jgi:MoaA/NifB/PqqE/SkfB family radical SAM enzyme